MESAKELKKPAKRSKHFIGLPVDRAVTKKDKKFYAINNAFLFIILLVMLFPILYLFANALSESSAVAASAVTFFPMIRNEAGNFVFGISFEGFRSVLSNERILTGYINTIIYTLLGTSINMILTVLAAYPLSRSDLPGKNKIMMLFAFTMIFNGGMIPNYILMMNLGVLNTRWAMVLPSAISVFNLAICRTFFNRNIPNELLEAAKIDGCSDFSFFLKVALPLSKPVLVVLALFYAVGHWNQFFNAFLYLTDSNLFPLQIVLQDILIANTITPEMLEGATGNMDLNLVHVIRFAAIIVACLPIWIVFPFLQKFFVQGVMIGSVKG